MKNKLMEHLRWFGKHYKRTLYTKSDIWFYIFKRKIKLRWKNN